MNAFHIKVIAIVCMVASHAGIFLLPQYTVLVAIGNVAFPLFAWLIANGARHSTDMKKYMLRLFAFACISQFPFTLANQLIGSPLFYLNVFFTLFLGLLAIAALLKTLNPSLRISAIAACAVVAQACNADYGAAGVLSIVASYLLFDRIANLAVAQFVILVVLPLVIPIIQDSLQIASANLYFDHPVNAFALLAALGVITLYNKEEGIRLRYFFYAFYPVHYLAISLFKTVFQTA
jgi:TraX protein